MDKLKAPPSNTGGTSARVAADGYSAATLLGVAFVVLKLCGVIGWSWWWVTAPFWGPIALAIILMAIGFMIAWALGSK